MTILEIRAEITMTRQELEQIASNTPEGDTNAGAKPTKHHDDKREKLRWM